MFTVKTDTVVFQSSLKKVLKNLKNQETVVFDEITLTKEILTTRHLEYSQHRLMEFIPLPGQH